MYPGSRRRGYETDATTVSSERLVILLYERIERDLGDARRAIAAGDTEARHVALVHAQQIVEELSYAVRPDVWEGGESLLALYDYVLNRLVKANIEQSTSALEEAAGIVGDLTTAWRDAYVTITTEAAPA